MSTRSAKHWWGELEMNDKILDMLSAKISNLQMGAIECNLKNLHREFNECLALVSRLRKGNEDG